MMRRFITIVLTLGATAGIAHAETVTLYASNNTQAIDAVLSVAREKLPDLDIEVVRDSTGTLLKRIEAEAENPQADVFWSGGFATLDAYNGLFTPYRANVAISDEMRGPNDLWTGTNVHVMVLMVNERQLGDSEAPQSWTDLFDPKWKDRIVFGDPSSSSSAYAQLYGLWKVYGREGLEKLAENVVVTGSSSNVYKSVASGEFAVGVTMEYSAHEYVAGGQSEIALIYPDDGTFLSPEGMAVIKGAPNPRGAEQLVDLLGSQQAQQAIFEATFRRPADSSVDVRKIAGLPNMSEINVTPTDDGEAAQARDELLSIWTEIQNAR